MQAAAGFPQDASGQRAESQERAIQHKQRSFPLCLPAVHACSASSMRINYAHHEYGANDGFCKTLTPLLSFEGKEFLLMTPQLAGIPASALVRASATSSRGARRLRPLWIS
jgi:hypothetical protein